MPLLPRIRPKVALFAQPSTLVAGEPVELRVFVDAPRPRKVERVDLWMEQQVRSSRGTAWSFRHHAKLSDRRTLPAGQTELRARALVPLRALPDHRGRRFSVSTLVRVSLQSRWRLDVNRSFQLRVRGAPSESPVQPLLFSSRAPGRDGPHLEGSLDRSVLRPGGMLTGRVAAIGADCRELSVRLVSTEEDPMGRSPGGHWTLKVDQPLAEGASVPFAMRIPDPITPSFRAEALSLSWSVELQAERAFARDLSLRIPVEIALGSGAPESLTEAPIVGNERVAALWARVGQQMGARFAGGALRDRVGDVDVTLRFVGGRLEARLAFPSLGIGLEGGERAGLRLFTGAFGNSGKVPELGERWNELFYVTSREPAQAEAFLPHALGHLVAVRFRSASDESLTLTVDAPRDDGSELERLLRLARRVAERIPAAALAMPIPAALEPHRESWEIAASSLEARLSPGAPRLEALDGSWSIETRWPDEGPRTTIVHRATTPIDERLHRDPGEALPEALSRDARPLAEALATEGELRIAASVVAFEREGAVSDPLALRPLLERLGRLVRLLRVDEGPYR